MKSAVFLALALGACCAPATLQAQASANRQLLLEDLNQLRKLSDPQISPDGAWVAYTVESVDVEKDKRVRNLWMARWDGSKELQLTSSGDVGGSVKWSPDGRYLSFLATRGDEDEKKKGAQVWLLDRSGGEARKLTDIKGGVTDCAWSPDSRRLALCVTDPNPRDEPEKLEGWMRKTKPPVILDRTHFKQDKEGYLGSIHTHLALFEVESRTLTPLKTGSFSESNPIWSPDGRFLAFSTKRGKDPDRTETFEIDVMEAKVGAVPRRVALASGSEGSPAWSPDGQWIAFLQGDGDKNSGYHNWKVALAPVQGGDSRILTGALDRPVLPPLNWSADGRHLFCGVMDDRISYLAKVAVADGKVQPLTQGRQVVSSVNLGPKGTLAYLVGDATHPLEVGVLDPSGAHHITHQNDPWLSGLRLATTEDFASRSSDGTEVHGVLVKPADFDAAKKSPLLLIIHGGPNGQDEHDFNFQRLFLASKGYLVLSVNYRGSAGRGSAFQRAIFADWGHLEVVDLLGAVEAAVARGFADPDRLGIGGWSYGGILTDYTIASDSRFKAAVSGAGSGNQLSMFGSDQYIVQYELELGPPWKAMATWLKLSYPFFKADRIKTPTLFMGGEKDFNVPIAGGEQMFQALRLLGVDTQLVIYPDMFHGSTVPSYQRDILARYLDWFDRYLKPRPISVNP